jgi:hypothetical protein
VDLAIRGRIHYIEDGLLNCEDRPFQLVSIRPLLNSRESTAGFCIDEQGAQGCFVQARQIEGFSHDGRRIVQEVPVRFEDRSQCFDLWAGQWRCSGYVICEITHHVGQVACRTHGYPNLADSEGKHRPSHDCHNVLSTHDHAFPNRPTLTIGLVPSAVTEAFQSDCTVIRAIGWRTSQSITCSGALKALHRDHRISLRQSPPRYRSKYLAGKHLASLVVRASYAWDLLTGQRFRGSGVNSGFDLPGETEA